MKRKNAEKGFTLIEVLVVIGIIAILAAVVLIAINPTRQFAQARDSQRVSNLTSLLNAIGQRLTDNKGIFAGTFTINGSTYTCGVLPTATTSVLTIMATVTTTATGDLGCLSPTYIPALPSDPSGVAGASDTGYFFYQDANGRVHVFASTTEPSIPRTAPLEIVR